MIAENKSELNSERNTIVSDLFNAIKSKDKDSLTDVLTKINEKLTNRQLADFKDIKETNKVVKNLFEQISKYGDGNIMVYLGDSGHSRLEIGVDDDLEPYAKISDSSSEEVKVIWNLLCKE